MGKGSRSMVSWKDGSLDWVVAAAGRSGRMVPTV